MVFKDRIDAGKRLAKLLTRYAGNNTIVYGLPRGGVVVAAEIAKVLDTPLDLIIVRKIGHPVNPEYAICAVTEDGHMICNEEERANVDEEWFEKEKENQCQEAQRRRKVYLGDRNPISAKRKIAILVDDGVATGLSLFCAINELKHQKPKRLVVAVPVSPSETADKIERSIDELISLEIPQIFAGAVGAYYENFDQVEDEEVVSILKSLGARHVTTRRRDRL